MERKKIFLAIPTLGTVHTLLYSRIIDWVISNKYQLNLYTTLNVQPVDRAREDIIDAFLKTDSDYLFTIDSDTIPPENAIDRLLAVDAPIATGLTPIVRFNKDKKEYYTVYNCINTQGNSLLARQGIVESIGAGGSCLLIKREVVEKTPRPLFRNTYTDDNGKDTFVSEDFYFISKARQNGFKTMADTSVICWHAKEVLW